MAKIYASADKTKLFKTTTGGLVASGTTQVLPTVSISSVEPVEEGQNSVFRVTLSAAIDVDVTFNYATSDGTAVAATDYTAASSTGTVLAGDTFVDIPIATIDNGGYTGTRNFILTISNATCSYGDLLISGSTALGSIIENDSAPSDPPPPTGSGSPLAALQHPRIGFVPEDAGYVFGRKLSTFKARMESAEYASSWSTFVSNVNSRFDTDPATKEQRYAGYDGMAYAFFAMADAPATMAGNWSGRTKADYIEKAKAHLFNYCAKYISIGVRETDQHDTGPVTTGAAMMYDWIMAADPTAISVAERQVIAEAAVDCWQDAASPDSIRLISNCTSELFRGIMLGMALYGDPISGNSTKTGRPYSEDIATMKGLVDSRFASLVSQSNLYRGSEWFHQEGGLYYQYELSQLWAMLAYSTATNTNYFYEIESTRNIYRSVHAQIRPHLYTSGVSRRVIKANTSYEWSPFASDYIAFYPGMLEGFSDTQAQFGRYLVSQYRSGGLPGRFTAPSTTGAHIASWLLLRFAYGQEHIPAVATYPPLKHKYGMGVTIWAGSNDKDSGAAHMAFMGYAHNLGGHQHSYEVGSLILSKRGNLTMIGGQGKSYNDGVIGSGSTSTFVKGAGNRLQSGCNLFVVDTSLAPTTTHITSTSFTTTTAPKTSYVIEYNTSDTAGVLGFVYSDVMTSTRASYARRDIIGFSDQGSGHDYYVVYDRVKVVDPSKHVAMVNLCLPHTPDITDSGTWTEITSIAGDDRAGVGPNLTGEWKSTNAKSFEMRNDFFESNDGVLFVKAIKPDTITAYRVGGDFGWWGTDANAENRHKTGDTDYVNKSISHHWAESVGRYRLELRGPLEAGTDKLAITLLQTSQASTTAAATESEYITNSTGSLQGVVIKDSLRTLVALGPSAVEPTTPITGTFTITLPSGSTANARLVIYGLGLDLNYAVTRVSNTITVTSGSGSAVTSNQGVLEVTV